MSHAAITENGSKITAYFVIAPSLSRSNCLSDHVPWLIVADEDEAEYRPARGEVDSSYADPLGPLPDRCWLSQENSLYLNKYCNSRPRTSVGGRQNIDDEFADEEIGDDLLPE